MNELKSKTIKELKEYCKEKKLVGYSKFTKKEDLINFIEGKKTIRPKNSISLLKDINDKYFKGTLTLNEEMIEGHAILLDKQRCFAIGVRNEIDNISIFKREGYAKIEKPKYLVAFKGDPSGVYVFEKNKSGYRQDYFDIASKLMKDFNIYYKNEANIMLVNKSLICVISPRNYTEISYKGEGVTIPYNEYERLSKMTSFELNEGIPIYYKDYGNKKFNLIVQCYVCGKVINKKPLNIEELAKLVNFVKTTTDNGTTVYMNDVRTTELILEKELQIELQKQIPNAKEVRLTNDQWKEIISIKKNYIAISNIKYRTEHVRTMNVLFKRSTMFVLLEHKFLFSKSRRDGICMLITPFKEY